jgi:hypothetical protein
MRSKGFHFLKRRRLKISYSKQLAFIWLKWVSLDRELVPMISGGKRTCSRYLEDHARARVRYGVLLAKQ